MHFMFMLFSFQRALALFSKNSRFHRVLKRNESKIKTHIGFIQINHISEKCIMFNCLII